MTIIVVDTASGTSTTTFLDLQTEFFSRGYDYLNQDSAGRTRAKRWINQSYLALCELYPWPFLEVEGTGTAPLEIPDLQSVIDVLDTTTLTRLPYMEHRGLTAYTANPDLVGTPTCYWLDDTTLHVYPTNTTDTLRVRYVSVPLALEADTETCIVPDRFTDLIIDGAVLKALKDSDEYTSRAALKTVYDEGVFGMASSLLVRNSSEPDMIATGW